MSHSHATLSKECLEYVRYSIPHTALGIVGRSTGAILFWASGLARVSECPSGSGAGQHWPPASAALKWLRQGALQQGPPEFLRGLSPNPFAFMDLLEISQILPKGQTTGFDGARPLRNCNPDGIRSGIRMAGFGGIWRDLGAFWRDSAGFGGNRLLTVFLLACKHLGPRRGFCVASDSRPNPFFALLLCSMGFGLRPPFVTPLLGFEDAPWLWGQEGPLRRVVLVAGQSLFGYSQGLSGFLQSGLLPLPPCSLSEETWAWLPQHPGVFPSICAWTIRVCSLGGWPEERCGGQRQYHRCLWGTSRWQQSLWGVVCERSLWVAQPGRHPWRQGGAQQDYHTNNKSHHLRWVGHPSLWDDQALITFWKVEHTTG